MDSENKYGTLEIQKQLLVLLEYFDNFCLQNRIKYSLAFGSLLGAVRHKGFIPWDDDVDVILDRNNYNKLISLISNNEMLHLSRSLWIDRIKLKDNQSLCNNATIDIFIFDNASDIFLIRKIHYFFLMFIQGMMKKEPNYKNMNLILKMCVFITFIVGRLFTESLKFKLYQKTSCWFNNSDVKYKGCYNVEYLYMKKIYPSEILEEYTRMTFENIEISGMSNYDKYLRILYGEYMIPPNEDQRKPKHGYVK